MEVIHRLNEWLDTNDTSRVLDLSNLNLDSLPDLPDNIEYLKCNNNYILYINRVPKSLKVLECRNNYILKLEELISLSKIQGFTLLI